MFFLNDVKQHPGVAVVFFVVGFVVGLGVFKYGAGFFNADVVLKGAYVYKSELESSYVPLQRFSAATEEINSIKSENDSLRSEVERLRLSQSEMSTSVCQRFATEANNLIIEQQRVESDIQALLSPYMGYSKKSEDRLNADRARVQEFRAYSGNLNVQLAQVRGEISKCNR
ncbi:hypothetical protein [Vreelandella sp. H-I2]